PEIAPGGTGTARIELVSTGTGRDGGKYVMSAPKGFTFTDNNVVTTRPDGTDAGHGWTLSSDKRTLTNTGAWWDAKGTWTISVGLTASEDLVWAGPVTAEDGLSFAVNGQPAATGDLTAGVRGVLSVKQTVVPELRRGANGNVKLELDSTGVGSPLALTRLTVPEGFVFTADDVTVKGPGGDLVHARWKRTADKRGIVNLNSGMWREKGIWTIDVSLTADQGIATGPHVVKGGISFSTGGGWHRLTEDLSVIVVGLATPSVSRAWFTFRDVEGRWSVTAEGEGQPGAEIQFRNKSGAWVDVDTVGPDRKFSFTTDDYPDDGIVVRQTFNGESSAETAKAPIGTGAMLSVDPNPERGAVGTVDFSRTDPRNWVGAFARGADPATAKPVWRLDVTTAYTSFEAKLDPGPYTFHAFADGSLMPIQSVDVDVTEK
ncbi:hypothetical protein, partial [Brucella intermedia]|uniref:hypothetical protein n=2 Tax=Brucella/Ochrobactrum group TaxID=2826938 RepID=UPI001AECE3BD